MAQNRWSLPTEITSRIIRLACRHELDREPYCHSTRNHLPGVANYAGVCREWQDLVERHTFRDLRLGWARLADVDRILCRRRQAYVRSVYLAVKLEPYGLEVYGDFETAEETARNSAVFSETLRLFFEAFSRWAPGAGISLSIRAFSPSDTGHCGETEMRRRRMDIQTRDIYSDRYKHSVLQLLTELPVVECVTELFSHRDRHISATAWALIINSLPNAKKMDIDFWENEKKDLELRTRLRNGKPPKQPNHGMRCSSLLNRDWRCPRPNALPKRCGEAFVQLRAAQRPLSHPADDPRTGGRRRLRARLEDLGAAAQGNVSLRHCRRARVLLCGF